MNSQNQESGNTVPRADRVVGIDYGTVRLGIAFADMEVGIATTWENYTRRSPKADAEYFRTLVREQRATRFVVGLPVHLNGEESQKSFEARNFGEWLTAETGVPVEYFDERFTSFEAEQALEQAGLTRKKRKARLDMLAAQIMLAGWLEAQSGRGDSPGPLEG